MARAAADPVAAEQPVTPSQTAKRAASPGAPAVQPETKAETKEPPLQSPQPKPVKAAATASTPAAAVPDKPAKQASPAAEAAPVALQFDFVAEEPAVKKPAANAKLATVTSVTKAQAGAAKKK